MAFIRHPKDFFAGLLFVAFGVAAITIGSNYTLGTAARMGPGYFPRILGILLIALGGALVVRALRLNGPPLPGWKWRPTVIVLASVALFGMIVNYAGVVLSTILLIVAASAASHEFRWRESLVAGVVLAALAVGVFVIGLKLQLPIWPAAF
ncbi:MAG TPA: tripartite tricarboxylate transporter TctB family protein [Casimicrobiaceae bacterium]